jgi:hypothetical protein
MLKLNQDNMCKNLIEITDDNGAEFYLVPSIGSNSKHKGTLDFIIIKEYLNDLTFFMGVESNRIGFNGDIDSMTSFMLDLIYQYQLKKTKIESID